MQASFLDQAEHCDDVASIAPSIIGLSPQQQPRRRCLVTVVRFILIRVINSWLDIPTYLPTRPDKGTDRLPGTNRNQCRFGVAFPSRSSHSRHLHGVMGIVGPWIGGCKVQEGSQELHYNILFPCTPLSLCSTITTATYLGQVTVCTLLFSNPLTSSILKNDNVMEPWFHWPPVFLIRPTAVATSPSEFTRLLSLDLRNIRPRRATYVFSWRNFVMRYWTLPPFLRSPFFETLCLALPCIALPQR